MILDLSQIQLFRSLLMDYIEVIDDNPNASGEWKEFVHKTLNELNECEESNDIVHVMPTPQLIKKDAIVKANFKGQLPPNSYNERYSED